MSDFKMVPLPGNKLENLIPLLHERYEEYKERYGWDRPDALQKTIREGYSMGIVDCYVDDVESPTHSLVLMRIKDTMEVVPSLLVLSVFITKRFRQNSPMLDSIRDTITASAKFHRVKRIVCGVRSDCEHEPAIQHILKAGFSAVATEYQLQLPC